jgi:type IV pilus assembly protein PilN
MIRINLLPREEKGHREVNIQLPKVGELFLPILVLLVVGVAIGGTAFAQRAKVDALTKALAKVDEESRALAPQIERVNRLAQERAELDLRLGIVHKLEQGRTVSVRVLDQAAACLPDHLWLTSLNQAGPTLTMEGVTYSNLVVSEFMTRLERSPLFAGVELDVAERSTVSEREVVKFSVSCKVTPDEPAN